MFAEMHLFNSLAPQQLDDYLAKGWFRMNQTVFTTHFLQFNHQFYSALWLRVVLAEYVPDKKHIHLNKTNSIFRTEIKKADISLRQEELFALYRQAVSFEPANDLQQLLLGYENENKFNSYEVNVFDGLTLIATGFFDVGSKSAAGITCFYHPAYKKYSLGKFLMFLKIDFCRQHQLDYFYPGYIVPGYSPFEYKATIGKAKLEYYNVAAKLWLPYKSFVPGQDPLQQMSEKLILLQAQLREKNVATNLMFYRFFDANLYPSCAGLDLFDFPIFLTYMHKAESNNYLLIVCNILDDRFHIVECVSIGKIDVPFESTSIFGTHLLKIYKEWLSTTIVEEIAAVLTSIGLSSTTSVENEL